MLWAGLYSYVLFVTISVVVAAWEAWKWYVRRRCRACDRAWALRRVPGTRRSGFVRFRCKHCGTKQWGVIEPRERPTVLPM